MKRSSRQFERFVRRVHRRLVLLRMAESAGAGALLAAVAMLILVPIRLYQGEPATALVGVALPLGVMAGLIWALIHRPSAMVAITEADRQLGLEDLLSTAWMEGKRSPDPFSSPFARAVVALAEARAGEIAPNGVSLSRFGQRAWGVIGLSCALAVVLAMISANPLTSRAAAANGRSNNRPALIPPTAQTPAGLLVPNPRNGAPNRPDFPGAKDPALDPAQHAEQGNSKGGARDPNQALANPDGTGGGAGRSQSTPNAADLTARGGTSGDGPAGRDTSGGGGAAADASGRKGASGTSAGTSAKAQPAPPWEGANWPAARRQAESAVDSGAIPAGYHDIIREYFR